MKSVILCTFSLITVALTGCTSMKTTSDRKAEYDFAQIDRYEWVQASDEILSADNTYVSDYLLKEIDNKLAARDWERVYTSDDADVQIIYFVKLAEHTEYTGPAETEEPRVTGGITFRRDTGTWAANGQEPDMNVYTIETGTLNLTIRNAESGEPIWVGTLTTRVDRSLPLDKQVKAFQKIARKIEAQIPVGSR